MAEIQTSYAETLEDKNREFLDRSPLGPVLQEAYTAALNKDPSVADVEFVPVPEDSPSFATAVPSWKSETGKPQVRFRVDDYDSAIQKYEAQINDRPNTRAMFAQKFSIREEDITPHLLYVASFAHELGHTVEHQENEADPAAYQRELRRTKEAMPLGAVAVSKLLAENSPQKEYVMNHWDMAVARTGVHTFEDMVTVQSAAYRELPTEHRADMFAGDIFWSLGAQTRDVLMDPNGTAEIREYHETQQALAQAA